MSKNKNNQKSAKDMAFDKERAKYRGQIRELELKVKQKDEAIEKLQETIDERDEKIRQQTEWIERLLEYTKLSEEDIEKVIEGQKHDAELKEHLSGLLVIGNKLGGSYFYGNNAD